MAQKQQAYLHLIIENGGSMRQLKGLKPQQNKELHVRWRSTELTPKSKANGKACLPQAGIFHNDHHSSILCRHIHVTDIKQHKKWTLVPEITRRVKY